MPRSTFAWPHYQLQNQAKGINVSASQETAVSHTELGVLGGMGSDTWELELGFLFCVITVSTEALLKFI